MYCIIEQERHPDACIDRVIGPYDLPYAEVYAIAQAMDDDPSNYIQGYGSRRNYYNVKDLCPPDNA